MAEGLVEAGGMVHCLDRAPKPPETFEEVKARTGGQSGGSLTYHQVDVTRNTVLEERIAGIAAEKGRLDGLIAGKWQHCLALS
jgi:D-arabinitol 2-dehydrogenase